jgi:hypothetical protein
MAMRLLLLMIACTFNVEPVELAPQTPAPDPGLAPAPSLPPASAPNDPPDLAISGPAAPDLAQAPDLTPATVTCTQDCNVNVPDNTTVTVVCDAKCDVSCGAGATCNVQCGQGEECSCKGAGCMLSGCVPTHCKGMTLVCNQQCD